MIYRREQKTAACVCCGTIAVIRAGGSCSFYLCTDPMCSAYHLIWCLQITALSCPGKFARDKKQEVYIVWPFPYPLKLTSPPQQNFDSGCWNNGKILKIEDRNETENGTKLKAESREKMRRQESREGSCKVMKIGRLSRRVELINE